MKHIVIGLVIGLFLFGAAFAGLTNEPTRTGTAGADVHAEGMRTVERTYTFTSPTVEYEDGYATVAIDGTRSIMQEGTPVLPYVIDVLRFPAGATVFVQTSTAPSRTVTLEQKIEPYPMYTLATTRNQLVIKEGTVYDDAGPFPPQTVESRVTVGLYEGQRMTTLSLFVYPCQYLPRDNLLSYTDSVTVSIDYRVPARPQAAADEYDLLIVTPSVWEDVLAPLAEHKEDYGISTKIVCLECIANGEYFPAEGRDAAEQIKYFIKNAIEQWGIRYVMLVGGRQGGIFKENWLMPVRYSNLDDQSNWDFAYLSDLYFADIYKYENNEIVFDDWDSNSNGVFAEWSGFSKDKLDMNPDVYLGRLACRNSVDVERMVEKIIAYESTYVKNQDWFNKIVVVAGDTFVGYGESVAEGEYGTERTLSYMEPAGFEGVELYTSTGTLRGIDDVVSTVSEGCGFLNFEGHGNPMNWATHPPNDPETWIDGLGVRDMSKLSNENMWPVCVVGGCHNSQFNVSLINWLKIWEGPEWYQYLYKGEATYKCWSWRLASTNGGGGSIATIGSTGLGYGYIGADTVEGLGGWIDAEFFRVYAQDGLEILGEVHTTTLANYVAQFPVQTDNIDAKTVQEWCLLGDPSLKIGGYA
jgi:hypothetical protein